MEILKLLDTHPIVESYLKIKKDIRDDGYYIKYIIKLIDQSTLHARDFFDLNSFKRDYSFHWQDATNHLIMRWDKDDNSPHRDIKTFPFHIHLPDKIIESDEMTLEMVMEIIADKIKKKKK